MGDTEKTEQAAGPSGLTDAIDRFIQDQEAAKQAADAGRKPAEEPGGAAKAAEPVPEPKGGEGTGGEPPKTAGAAPVPRFRLVNEKGEDSPFVLKVDGAEIPIDDPEKLRTYAQLGYHGSQRLEGLNKREAEIRKAEGMIEKIVTAIQDGRIAFKPPAAEPSAKADEARGQKPEGEEELYVDPELAKERKERLRLEKEVMSLKGLVLGKVIKEEKSSIDTQIASAKKQHPFAREKDVWNYLNEVDENGRPAFTVEAAVQKAHEEMVEAVKTVIASHPDFTKLSEEQKKEAVAEYLRQKDEQQAPVSSPAGGPVVGPKKPEKREFTSLTDAMERFNEEVLSVRKEAQGM